MNEPPKATIPSFVELFRYWIAVGMILAATPFFLALYCDLLGKSRWDVLSVIVGVLFWILIYTRCHQRWYGTIFIRFPNFQTWFRVAVVIRILLAFTIYGEMIMGFASGAITAAIGEAIGLTDQGQITGMWVIIHGGCITLSILIFTFLIGLVHTFCRKLCPRQPMPQA